MGGGNSNMYTNSCKFCAQWRWPWCLILPYNSSFFLPGKFYFIPFILQRLFHSIMKINFDAAGKYGQCRNRKIEFTGFFSPRWKMSILCTLAKSCMQPLLHLFHSIEHLLLELYPILIVCIEMVSRMSAGMCEGGEAMRGIPAMRPFNPYTLIHT